MKKILFYCLIIIGLFLGSCVSTENTFKKEIKLKYKTENNDLIYENSVAILHFDREITKKILEYELKKHSINKCYKTLLISCIEKIEIGNNTILDNFQTKEKTNSSVEELQNRIIEILLLKSKFSIYNKEKKIFEKLLIYNKRNGNGYCCNVDFEFSDGSELINTRRFSDSIVLDENCE